MIKKNDGYQVPNEKLRRRKKAMMDLLVYKRAIHFFSGMDIKGARFC